METTLWWSAGGEVKIKKYNGDHCMVERGEGKFE